MNIRSTLVFAFSLSVFSLPLPSLAAGPSVSAVLPTTATVDQPVELTAKVSSTWGIKSCNLYVDLADVGPMVVSGGIASRSYTFNAGGSRIAFVFCKDNASGMASGPNTAIWVEGKIVQIKPLGEINIPLVDSSLQQNNTTTVIPLIPGQIPDPQPKTPQTTPKLVKMLCTSTATVDDPCKAVYYISVDGKRHAFSNSKVYFTWYANFDAVQEITAQELAAYPLGKNVTYRPGVRMVKFITLDKVYAVGKGGTLHWVKDENLAKGLYGAAWNTQIDDIADTFFLDYAFGGDVSGGTDFNPQEETGKATSIDYTLGLLI